MFADDPFYMPFPPLLLSSANLLFATFLSVEIPMFLITQTSVICHTVTGDSFVQVLGIDFHFLVQIPYYISYEYPS